MNPVHVALWREAWTHCLAVSIIVVVCDVVTCESCKSRRTELPFCSAGMATGMEIHLSHLTSDKEKELDP